VVAVDAQQDGLVPASARRLSPGPGAVRRAAVARRDVLEEKLPDPLKA
jgi:hypothetical protein